MDFYTLAAQRQSCRDFSGKPVGEETLRRILACARLAPSACNTQPWHLYGAVGESLPPLLPALRERFAGIGGLILVAERKTPLPFGSGENPFRQMDIGLCVMQAVLAATQEGLASCIIGIFDEALLRAAFSLPPEETPRLVIALGEATAEAAHLREKDRLPKDAVETVLV